MRSNPIVLCRYPLPRIRRFTQVWLGLLAASVVAVPLGAQDAACGPSSRPLPELSACPPDAGVAALFAEAEGEQRAGNFAAADLQLDCAEAAIERSQTTSTAGAAEDTRDARYQLARRRGILDYRREHLPQALSWFECALRKSSARSDSVAMARDLNNVGSVLRRLGDFSGALRALTVSLDLQRESDSLGGAVLNNIADMYRELEDHDAALRYYHEALAVFAARHQTLEASHVLEAMSELSLNSGDTESAQRWLKQALDSYREAANHAYQLRAHGGLIRASLDADQLQQAQAWSASALALAASHGLQTPASLQRQIARTERLLGKPADAEARLRSVLSRLATGDIERPPLREELAAALEARGEPAAALAEARRAHQEESRLARAQHDRQLGWLRTRFELSERDHTIITLASEKELTEARLRQRTLVLGLALALTLAILLSLWLVQQRRSQRERVRVAAERVREQEELQRYRREADALAEDRSLLQALLDSRESALCLLDADGQLLAANLSARRLLGSEPSAPIGRSISEFLPAQEATRLVAALEQMEDASVQQLELMTHGQGQTLQAQLSQWGRGDGLIVMELSEETAAADADDHTPAELTKPEAEQPLREDFKRSVVELMLTVVDAWERATGSNRLELAEKSRIWRVSIDDGRLRARAMERYLAVSKLPRNPRWRDVLRSAYFVLGQCALDAPVREDLKRRADTVLAYTRREALV